MRINKYLADKGLTTRRGADKLIEAGQVTINGRKAKLGDQVNETDKVVISAGAAKKLAQSYRYYAYNKPLGIVTHSPHGNEKEIADVINLRGVAPLGRLDKDSHGLILLSNDGRITERLLSPQAEHEKEYLVKVDKPLMQNTLTRLSKGVKIEGYITKPAQAEELSPYTLRLTITEGKRHQIRRMLAALGYVVRDLQRTRIMHINLGPLKAGEYRELTSTECSQLMNTLGLK